MASPHKNLRMNIRTARMKVVELANYIYSYDSQKHQKILTEAFYFLPKRFQKMLDYKVK